MITTKLFKRRLFTLVLPVALLDIFTYIFTYRFMADTDYGAEPFKNPEYMFHISDTPHLFFVRAFIFGAIGIILAIWLESDKFFLKLLVTKILAIYIMGYLPWYCRGGVRFQTMIESDYGRTYHQYILYWVLGAFLIIADVLMFYFILRRSKDSSVQKA